MSSFELATAANQAADVMRAIASLAWPILVLVVVLLFRTQITSLLSGGVRRLRAGPFEMEWDRQVSEVEAEVDTRALPQPQPMQGEQHVSEDLRLVAERAPHAAVMEAYALLEERLRVIVAEAGLQTEPGVRLGAVRLARIAGKAGLISEEDVRAVQGVAVLRNMAAHRTGGTEITVEQAVEYLALIDGILYALSARRE